jgi:glycosyltransferase involved in cell wall biosynthesis
MRPRIIAYVAINHASRAAPLLSLKWPFLGRTRLLQKLLWPRLNGVAACATKSMECGRRIGLPARVRILVNYLPVFGPKEASSEGITLPWRRETSFTIGFAGSLIDRKGWRTLVAAAERLPEKFKIVMVGDGEQREQLLTWIEKANLKGRVYYAGLLPRDRLMAAYSMFDLLVLPSISTPSWTEQFGCVLGEAMACGVPVVGSDSGAIPETVEKAGLIVPEGNPDALAKAIIRMSEDETLRRRAIACGLERYNTFYSCDAYARSIGRLLGLERNVGS